MILYRKKQKIIFMNSKVRTGVTPKKIAQKLRRSNDEWITVNNKMAVVNFGRLVDENNHVSSSLN